jgi:double-stranded uracil-DNA glycosylase
MEIETLHALPDLMAPDLKVIFVGTAAGKRSKELGHYYAGRGNRFWSTLHEIGLTPHCFAPSEFRNLLPLGIGLSDMSKLGSGMDHEISKSEYDPELFDDSLRRYRPRAVAFTSKKTASVWRRGAPTSEIAYGRQPRTSAVDPEFFVLPSPSGAARSSWAIEPWHELAAWLRDKQISSRALV